MNQSHVNYNNSDPLIVKDVLENMRKLVTSDIQPETFRIVTDEVSPSAANITGDTPRFEIPLYPKSGNTNFVWNEFVNFCIQLRFSVTKTGTAGPLAEEIPFWVGFLGPHFIAQQCQIKLGTNTICTIPDFDITGLVTFASLPQHIIDTDSNYSTIQKILAGNPCLGAYFNVSESTDAEYVTVDINGQIDLNKVFVELSNIPFIQSYMGDLRLEFQINKERLYKSACLLRLPRGGYVSGATSRIYTAQCVQAINFTGFHNYAYKYNTTQYTTNAATPTIAQGTENARVFTFSLYDYAFRELRFTQHTFISTTYDEVRAFFKSAGQIIFPTQHYAVSLATHSIYNNVWNINASNISMFCLLFHENNNHTQILPHARLKAIQYTLNGNALNTQYSHVNGRYIYDVAQAFGNDVTSLNTSLMETLRYNNPSKFAKNTTGFSSLTISDDTRYYGTDTSYQAIFNYVATRHEMVAEPYQFPQLFIHAVQTGMKSAFHSGATVFELSGQRAVQIGFSSSGSTVQGNTTTSNCPTADPSSWNPQHDYCVALCDVGIVLNLSGDSVSSGSLTYARLG